MFAVRPVSDFVVVVRVSASPPFTFSSYVVAVPFHVISAEVSVMLLAERAVGASHGSVVASSVMKLTLTQSETCSSHIALTSTV